MTLTAQLVFQSNKFPADPFPQILSDLANFAVVAIGCAAILFVAGIAIHTLLTPIPVRKGGSL